MVRATSAVARKKRKKRLFKRAKGFWGDRKNHARLTLDAVMKAMAFATAHRRKKKGDFRSIWIQRISVAAKMNGISYSRMINGMSVAKCEIDRKMLADLAVKDPEAFKAVAETAKAALA